METEMKQTQVLLNLDELYALTIALVNDPTRPTISGGSDEDKNKYLDLLAKLQEHRKELEAA